MINFNMPYIWQTMPDSLTITPRQNVRFQNGLKNFTVIKFKMADYWPVSLTIGHD